MAALSWPASADRGSGPACPGSQEAGEASCNRAPMQWLLPHSSKAAPARMTLLYCAGGAADATCTDGLCRPVCMGNHPGSYRSLANLLRSAVPCCSLWLLASWMQHCMVTCPSTHDLLCRASRDLCCLLPACRTSPCAGAGVQSRTALVCSQVALPAHLLYNSLPPAVPT